MTVYNEVNIQRILNPTSIDLGEYVINPYMGCEYACLYCYVRFNKVISRKKEPWGTYVDVRMNAPYLLKKEIQRKKPHTVLLGSTTECFQPAEQSYGITAEILEILNKYKVYYVILTRSVHIAHYLPLLSGGFCKNIYFAFNNMTSSMKRRLEAKSAPFNERIKVINILLENGLPIVPYFSPVIPWISHITHSFEQFPLASSVSFEGLNFRLGNIDQIISAICSEFPHLRKKYDTLRTDRKYYESYWDTVKKQIIKEAIKAKKKYNIYIHGFSRYFENKYSKKG